MAYNNDYIQPFAVGIRQLIRNTSTWKSNTNNTVKRTKRTKSLTYGTMSRGGQKRD